MCQAGEARHYHLLAARLFYSPRHQYERWSMVDILTLVGSVQRLYRLCRNAQVQFMVE